MDIGWKVIVLPAAQSELDGLDDRVRLDALKIIIDLTDDPFPVGSVLLRGHLDLYRIRCYRDKYRIIYQVSEKQRAVHSALFTMRRSISTATRSGFSPSDSTSSRNRLPRRHRALMCTTTKRRSAVS